MQNRSFPEADPTRSAVGRCTPIMASANTIQRTRWLGIRKSCCAQPTSLLGPVHHANFHPASCLEGWDCEGNRLAYFPPLVFFSAETKQDGYKGHPSCPDACCRVRSRESQPLRECLPSDRADVNSCADERGNQRECQRQNEQQMENAPPRTHLPQQTRPSPAKQEGEGQGRYPEQKR